jgi:site-specific DNA-methyltransferase (adenine-specific)
MNKIIWGDAVLEMQSLEENSVDAIITDPPYGLEFMGKEWDKFKKAENIGGGTMKNRNTPYQRGDKTPPAYYIWTNEQKIQMQLFFQEWAKECLRVLKPGGYLLSFGGTRTYHRMTCGIEDAGFEIRDTIMWLYGVGFPKSLNIGKQIDKIQGNEREFIGFNPNGFAPTKTGQICNEGGKKIAHPPMTKGTSEWEGWGTALKPACEPIVVARKPLSEKNVALNVLKWGTGGINIDACRIGDEKRKYKAGLTNNERLNDDGWDKIGNPNIEVEAQGRFPSNIILDEEAGKMLDEQSGTNLKSGLLKAGHPYGLGDGQNVYGKLMGFTKQDTHADKGGASRFFYCAKASKSERNFGLDDLEDKHWNDGRKTPKDYPSLRKDTPRKNNHPTVKPIKLMEYLIKLVTREGSVVLDPFLGSGTTAIACLKLNRQFIGIEKEDEYVKIAKARIKPFLEQRKL